MKITIGKKYRWKVTKGIVLVVGKSKDGSLQVVVEKSGGYIPAMAEHELEPIN